MKFMYKICDRLTKHRLFGIEFDDYPFSMLESQAPTRSAMAIIKNKEVRYKSHEFS